MKMAIWQEVRELETAKTRMDNLEATLYEVLIYFDDHADVVDGEDGKPEPNQAMQYANMIRDALGI